MAPLYRGISTLSAEISESIYGSNAIEHAGGSRNITSLLHHRVFSDSIPILPHLSSAGPELDHLRHSGRGTDEDSVLRSRREIVQHALAYKYLMTWVVVREEQLSEEMLKEAHGILMGLSGREDKGGLYRVTQERTSHGVRAETDEEYEGRIEEAKSRGMVVLGELLCRRVVPRYESEFITPQNVPVCMEALVRNLDGAIRELRLKGSKVGVKEVVDVATRFCTLFVCIHPFKDGNERMGMLLMNCVFMRFLGTCVPIGGEEWEREAYVAIVWRANGELKRDEREGRMWEGSSHGELRGLVGEKIERKRRGVNWTSWDRLGIYGEMED